MNQWSVTFFSYGYMPNDEAKLYIYSDNFSKFINRT